MVINLEELERLIKGDNNIAIVICDGDGNVVEIPDSILHDLHYNCLYVPKKSFNIKKLMDFLCDLDIAFDVEDDGDDYIITFTNINIYKYTYNSRDLYFSR